MVKTFFIIKTSLKPVQTAICEAVVHKYVYVNF